MSSKIIFRTILIFLYILLIANIAIADILPHIRTFLVEYGKPGPDERTEISQHYDLTIGLNISDLNPSSISLAYILFTTMVIPSGKFDKLQHFCNQRELEVEDTFLHMKIDTDFTLPITQGGNLETRTVKGWDPVNDINGDGYIDDTEFAQRSNPNASARYKDESRIPIYYWGPPSDYVMNVGNANYQEFLMDYAPGVVGNYNGLFVDTSFPLYPRVPSDAMTNILEYPYGDPETVGAKWRSDLLTLYTKIKTGLPMVIGNNWNTWDGEPLIIDGRLKEEWFHIGIPVPKFQQGFGSLTEVVALEEQGKIQLLQYRLYAEDLIGSPAESRDKMFGLASYYLVHGDNTYLGFHGSGNYGGGYKNWFKAIEYDIGKPLGPYYVLAFKEVASNPTRNLLYNGDFEIDRDGDGKPDGWTTREHATIVSDEKHSGNFSVMIDNIGSANEVNRQYLSLKPNTIYTFGGWIKTQNAENAHIYMYDFEGATGEQWVYASKTWNWKLHTSSFITASDTDGRINFRLRESGTAWFDALFLIEGDYNVFARDYEEALVLVKPMPTTTSSFETVHTYNLSGKLLRADGTLSGPITQLDLRNGEAAILIGAKKVYGKPGEPDFIGEDQ